jgi:hypothetical protein
VELGVAAVLGEPVGAMGGGGGGRRGRRRPGRLLWRQGGGGGAVAGRLGMSPRGLIPAHKTLIPVDLRSGRRELRNPRRPTIWPMGVK